MVLLSISFCLPQEEAMEYGQGNRYSELMGLLGSTSENSPEPSAALLWKEESTRPGHGMGYSVERLNNEWSRPPLAHGKRSFESAMNYFSRCTTHVRRNGEFEGGHIKFVHAQKNTHNGLYIYTKIYA